jgi:hypothetical protein
MKLIQFRKTHFFLLVPFLILISIISLDHYSAKLSPEKASLAIITAVQNQIPKADYYDLYFRSTPVATVDNYSECIELGHVLSDSKLPFASRPGSASENSSPCEKFSREISSDGNQVFYGRFFHGTAAALRVFLGYVSYQEIQIISSVVILFLLTFLTLVLARKSRFEAAVFGLILFGLTDFPFQGNSLTHGISTIIGLIMVIVLLFLRDQSKVILFSTSLTGGFAYCYFAQLYTPLAFALLSVVAVASSRNRDLENVSNHVFSAWIIGYFGGIGLRFIQGALTFGLKPMLEEDGGGLTNRLTSSISGLARVTYMHLILNPSKYPLKILVFLLISFLLGILVTNIWKETTSVKLHLPIFPFAFTCIWYLSLGGHDGHGWVANLLFILIGYVVLALNPQKSSENKSYQAGQNDHLART